MILAPRERIAEYTSRGWWGNRRIHDWFADSVRANPQRLALCDPPNREAVVGGTPRRLSWLEVDRAVDSLAGTFASFGIRKDDVVLVQLPNCVELPIAYLACLRLGAIITPVPVQYREHELAHILGLTQPRLLLTAQRVLKHGHLEMLRRLAPANGQVLGLHELPAAAGASAPPAEVDANDIATICWTSGTEGVPKGVPRSHNEWLAIPENIIVSAGLQEGAHLLNPFPLVNMAGIAGQLLPWLILGGRLVMHHPFSLEVFLTQLREEDIDYSVAAPALLTTLAQNAALLDGIAGRRLRALGSGGGPLPEWTVRTLAEQQGISVVNYFGTNEGASLTSSALDLPDPALRATYFPRFGAGGHEWKLPVSRRVSTRLVGPDSGDDIEAPGVPGELRVKGPAIFAGYWRAPELTARAFDERGYFRTGDLFEIAGDRGQLYRFAGRLKDIIVRGGFNISSEEVESLLLAHPAVREAAVVGFPDQVLGERVCAVVVPHPGATPTLEGLVAFLRDSRHVAAYKLPERLVTVEALPRNPVGKVLKRALREGLVDKKHDRS
jgi:acyl-CoA synthetase